MSAPILEPHAFSAYHEQDQSPLFALLPAEIRSEIWAYALTDYEDTGSTQIATSTTADSAGSSTSSASRLYSAETCYRRPGYNAPRRTCTELLRTCKRVLNETWFMPFALAEHSLYLTAQERAPQRHVTEKKLQEYLDVLHAHAAKVNTQRDGRDPNPDGREDDVEPEASCDDVDDIKIDRIRVFAQMYMLEPGTALQRILDLRHFRPRKITITLRYTDFWYWEADTPLWVDSPWVNTCRFPPSVTELCVEFESVVRRKAEVEFIAREAAEKWVFRRRDHRLLRATYPDSTSTMAWTGRSTWMGNRWVRDESRPNEIDYHLVSVVWRVSRETCDEEDDDLKCPKLQVPADFPRPAAPFPHRPSIPVYTLQAAEVAPGASAEEALAAVAQWEQMNRRIRYHRRPRMVWSHVPGS